MEKKKHIHLKIINIMVIPEQSNTSILQWIPFCETYVLYICQQVALSVLFETSFYVFYITRSP